MRTVVHLAGVLDAPLMCTSHVALASGFMPTSWPIDFVLVRWATLSQARLTRPRTGPLCAAWCAVSHALAGGVVGKGKGQGPSAPTGAFSKASCSTAKQSARCSHRGRRQPGLHSVLIDGASCRGALLPVSDRCSFESMCVSCPSGSLRLLRTAPHRCVALFKCLTPSCAPRPDPHPASAARFRRRVDLKSVRA